MLQNHPLTASTTATLDRLESELPSVAAKTLSLSRATARRTFDTAGSIASGLTELAGTAQRSITTAGKTAFGQATSAAQRATDEARSAGAEATGQARAQAQRATDKIGSKTGSLLDEATESVDPDNSFSLDDLTKAELYDRAQTADIDGRSSMSKPELIAALRSH